MSPKGKEGDFYCMCTMWQAISHMLFPLVLYQGKNYFPYCLDKKLGLEKINVLSGNT